MSGFSRPGRSTLDQILVPVGRGWIRAALFDLGIYPAAIPASDSRVWGEVYQMLDADAVLSSTDELEGVNPTESDSSLYTRAETLVTMEDGREISAWAYFYNAPLGRAERIASGDYREHLKAK
jgi:gamma-glutamylcyclotransferase (GGCT)/AIG2-like uncharacterized protein YtfP